MSVTVSAATATLATTDATLSDGRNKVINVIGSPGANCTITITPNDAEKWYFVRNNTTGGFDLIFTQGSGGNFTLKNGKMAVIHCDGAGAGAAVVGTLKDVQFDSLITEAGTVSAPAVAPSGDSNTGIYYPGADQVAVATGGTQRALVDSSGLTTAQRYNMSDGGGGAAGWSRSHPTLAQIEIGATSASAVSLIANSAEKVRIESDGKVGIGSSVPTVSGTGKLHHAGNTIRAVDALRTPSSASDTGNQGEICFDATHVYCCIATNTWRRAPHSTW